MSDLQIHLATEHLHKAFVELGFDMTEPGKKDTPKRIAKMWAELLSPPVPSLTVFPLLTDEMVVENGIPVHSFCEHHGLPFFGTATVAYLPNGQTVLGISKLARIVEYFARRFQTQEQLTGQVAHYLNSVQGLNPQGVGVSIRCVHTCMSVRGVRAHGATTLTQSLLGAFKTDRSTRQEFLNAVEH